MNKSSVVKLDELIHEEYESIEAQERYEIAKKYAVLDRVQEKARNWKIDIPSETLANITRLISKVNYSVAVVTRKSSNPHIVKVSEDKLFYYQLEANENSDSSKHYLLSVWCSLSPEAVKLLKTEKFAKWLAIKGIPFISEILGRVDLSKDVSVRIHRGMRNFVHDVMSLEIADADFIGQTVKDGSFSKEKSVGIVKENVVNIYDPTWKYGESAWTFRAFKENQ